MADSKKALSFEREQAAYAAHRGELLKTALGQFVAIYGDRIIGPYPTYADAYAEALRSFGSTSQFMIKQVLEEEPTSSPIFGVSKNQANLTCRFTM